MSPIQITCKDCGYLVASLASVDAEFKAVKEVKDCPGCGRPFKWSEPQITIRETTAK